MNEKKCSSQEASFYVNDLFDTLDIKGNNQLLFNQMCALLMRFSVGTIKESWKDIVYSCEPPNGQMAGRLPKMYVIEKILMNNRINSFTTEHKKTKEEPMPKGLVSKLWEWGIEYRDGKITKQELEKRIDDNL